MIYRYHRYSHHRHALPWSVITFCEVGSRLPHATTMVTNVYHTSRRGFEGQFWVSQLDPPPPTLPRTRVPTQTSNLKKIRHQFLKTSLAKCTYSISAVSHTSVANFGYIFQILYTEAILFELSKRDCDLWQEMLRHAIDVVLLICSWYPYQCWTCMTVLFVCYMRLILDTDVKRLSYHLI